ncbi:Aldehyde dehydrogenase domain [Trinorchestia longiramus]|nr:Aldehyde dehydrogenase domain [Trinorchestia longiramus]
MASVTAENRLEEIFSSMEYGPAPEDKKIVQAWLSDHNNKFGHFINNEFVITEGSKFIDSTDPATGEVLAKTCQGTEEDVDVAVKAAAEAYTSWSELSGHARARHLYSFARHVQKHSRLLAVLESCDNGKTIRETRDCDIPLVVRHLYYYAGWAQLLDTELSNWKSIGVVGAIVPWNFPLMLLSWKLCPALAAGNTVVLKPATNTRLSALLLAQVAAEAGLPAGVFNVVTGGGTMGSALSLHPLVDKVAFTGSTEVGQLLRRLTAGTGKKLSLELGGKSPVIIYDSADLDSAVEGVVDAIFFNQGQVCSAGSRLLVQESVYEAVLQKIRRRMQNLRVGLSLDKTMDMAAVVTEQHRQSIEAFVQSAKDEGAEVFQVPVPPGCFYSPTLITGVTPASVCVEQEIFGPVLVAMSFRTAKEAINLANNSVYGLGASVFSERMTLALETARQLKAGSVWLNCHNMFDAAAGFGGYKHSGFGRDGGQEGLYEYIKPKWQQQLRFDKPDMDMQKFGSSYSADRPCMLVSDSASLPRVDRTYKLYYGGSQKRPDANYSRVVLDPSERTFAVVAEANRKDVRNAVEAANKAQPGWAKRSGFNRSQILYYLAENLEQRRLEYVEHISALTGEVSAENLEQRRLEYVEHISALTGCSSASAEEEVCASIERLFVWAAYSDKHGGSVQETTLYGTVVKLHEPVGVVAVACPDAFPLLAFVSLVGAAVARGNAVVVVPSQKYPSVAMAFQQILETSDVPGGVVNILTGSRDHLSKYLTEHHDVQSIWYFGSLEGSCFVEHASADSVKRTWVDYGLPRAWLDALQGAEVLTMSVCHGKRNSYTTDFKIKVLEFYLKNGGESVFGLKSRTAEHFNIGKKTVVRIVENKEVLLRAKASKSKKSVDGVTKSASTSKVVTSTKKVQSAGGSSKASVGTAKPVPSQGSKTSVLSLKTSKVGLKNVANVAAKKEGKKEVASPQSATLKSTASPQVTEDHKKPSDLQEEHEEVLDLPEDPDYAILKVPIDGGTTATGVAGPALLLSTATDEVRRALVYECEVLYECKVCRSLFRSVVNFLAHKRIFCTLSHNSNNTFYHEGASSRLTPHSSTVVTSVASGGGSSPRVSTRKCHQASSATGTASSATNSGSSAYYDRLEQVERGRAAASEDCRVELEVAGKSVSNAVYQTFLHPDTPPQQPSLQNARLAVREHELGVMAVLGKDGRIVSTVSLDGQNLTEIPRTDEADVLPSNEAHVLPSNEGEVLPSKETDVPPSKEIDVPPSNEAEVLPSNEAEGLPSNEAEVLPSNEAEGLLSNEADVRPSNNVEMVYVKEEPVDLDQSEEEEEQATAAVTEQLRKATFHRKANTQIDPLRRTIKNNTLKEKDVRSKVRLSRDSEDAEEASPSCGDVTVKTEAGATGSFSRSKRVECGGSGGDGGVTKRWMCNVCGKLYVTHTASLAHAATHSDSSFLPKPQLVDVLISRKAFSRVLPRHLNADTIKGPIDVDKTEGFKSTNKLRLTTESHPVIPEREPDKQASNQGLSSRQSTLELSDVAAFNILKTNNMRYREEAFPFQSIDQRGALEKSIKKIYDRHKSLASEPKAHEILLQTRQTVKKLEFQSQHTDSGTREVSSKHAVLSGSSNEIYAGNREQKLKAGTGTNKRKLSIPTASNSDSKTEFESPSRRRKEDLSPGIRDNPTPVISSAFSSTKTKLSEYNMEGNPLSSSMDSSSPICTSKSDPEVSVLERSPAAASSSTDCERFQTKNSDKFGKLKPSLSDRVQSSFSKSLSSTNDKLFDPVPQAPAVTVCKSTHSKSSGLSGVFASTTSGNDLESRELKSVHHVSPIEDISSSKPTTLLSVETSVKRTSNAWDLYEEDWADEEEEEAAISTPAGTPTNGNLCFSISAIKPQENVSEGAEQNSRKISGPAEAAKEKMNAQLNSGSKFVKLSTSSYSECRNSSESNIIGTSMSASGSCLVTNEFSRALDSEKSKTGDSQHTRIDSFVQRSQLLRSSNGKKPISDQTSNVNIFCPDVLSSKIIHSNSFSSKSKLKNQSCSSSKEASLNLFDCGSMAEQELDDERHTSKGRSFSDLLTAGPASTSARDDTLMQEASSLGLFDTGFEECRLHSDQLEDDTLPSPREQSPVAGPSYR